MSVWAPDQEMNLNKWMQHMIWTHGLRNLMTLYFEFVSRSQLNLMCFVSFRNSLPLVTPCILPCDQNQELFMLTHNATGEDDDVCHTSAFRISSSAEGDLSLRLVSRQAEVPDRERGKESSLCLHRGSQKSEPGMHKLSYIAFHSFHDWIFVGQATGEKKQTYVLGSRYIMSSLVSSLI